MKQCVVALDVGGTSVKAAIVDDAGVVLHQARMPTPSGVPVNDALDRIADCMRSLLAVADARGLDIAGVCCAVPGIVDDVAGVARYSANLGWRDVPVAVELSSRLARRVRVTHDVRAGGLAESRVGASAGACNSLFVAVGTGISAAIVIDGSPVLAGGWAGEIGHVRVAGNDRPCACGRRGCLETVASAAGIVRTFAELSGLPATGAEQVADLVRAGDPVATSVWAAATDALGDVLGVSAAVLGTRVVVVGGGLSHAGSLLLEPLTARIEATIGPGAPPRVVGAALGDAAGCLGAAMMAWPEPQVTPR